MATILERKRRLVVLGLMAFAALVTIEWLTEGEDIGLIGI